MRLSDEQVEVLFKRFKELGHNDPVGVIARSLVLTNLDPEHEGKDSIGLFGIRQAHIKKLGVGEFNVEDSVGDQIGMVLMLDEQNRSAVDNLDQMHVAYQFNEKIAKQKRWGKKIRSWVGRVNARRKDVLKILGEPVVDQEAELKRDKVDREITKALDFEGGTLDREARPPSLTEQYIAANPEDGDLATELNEMLNAGEITTEEVDYITDGKGLSGLTIERERAIGVLMNLLDT